MLKRLEIDNFKTLNRFAMDFSPMTVIVGNNASGKSTILQVLSMLSSCVQEDFPAFFDRRGWNVSELRSKCKGRLEKVLRVAAEIEITADGRSCLLRWEMQLQYDLQRNSFLLMSERVQNMESEQVLLEFSEMGGALFGRSEDPLYYPQMILESSFMKVALNVHTMGGIFPELAELKRFLTRMRSYELLSPDQMRTSSRGRAEYLSISGKNLPIYLKSLPEEKKDNFLLKLKKLLGDKIERVSTETRKPGWVYMVVEEKYEKAKYRISSGHLSDGLLRLLAIVAISESKNCSMSMLDEIENGINSSYAEGLIGIFRDMSGDGTQMVLTTHSVVFLDYVEKDEIVFLYRSETDGSTKAVRIFDTPELAERLEYMYPGEIIYNLGNQELVELCMQHMG